MKITAFCRRHKSSEICASAKLCITLVCLNQEVHVKHNCKKHSYLVKILIKCLLLKQNRWIFLIEEVWLPQKVCGISRFTCYFAQTPDQTNNFHSFLKAFRHKNVQQASNSRFTYPLLYSSYVGENIAAEAEAGVSPGNGSHRLLLCLTASRAAGASSSAPQLDEHFSEGVFLMSYHFILMFWQATVNLQVCLN